MRKNNRLGIWLAAALSVVLAACVLGFLYLRLPEQATFRQKSAPEDRIADAMKLRSIRQNFVASRDGLTGIELKMAVPEKDLGSYKGTLVVSLTDQNGTLVARQAIPAGGIVNYEDCAVAFAPVARSAGVRYTIQIEPRPADGNEKVDLFAVRGDGGGLSIDGREKNERLEFDCVYHTTRLGSLYNGRLSAAEVDLILVLCVLSVLLLGGIIVFFLRQGD